MNRQESIKLLNAAIAEELQSIDQYLYFHFHCEDRGYNPLAKIFERVSIVEMKHTEMLALRILFLGGDVEMRRAGATEKIRDVEEMLKCGMKLEAGSIDDYNKWANVASENADSATKTLFEKLIVEEEDHYDIFDNEMKNLKTFGESYLALQAIDRSRQAGEGTVSK